MRIKFLVTTPSDHPAAPFQAGQIINIPMDERVRGWLRDEIAVALDAEPEAASLGDPPETAARSRPRTRGSR